MYKSEDGARAKPKRSGFVRAPFSNYNERKRTCCKKSESVALACEGNDIFRGKLAAEAGKIRVSEVAVMQRVANCVLRKGDEVLLLQKPRRNWWVAPGGKMEQGETIREAVTREYREETGIYLKDPTLKGVFTIIIKEGNEVISEWMMFTFLATDSDGENKDECEEGILKWHHKDALKSLLMAPGDYHIIDYMLEGKGIIYGNFVYTPDFELLSYRLDPS